MNNEAISRLGLIALLVGLAAWVKSSSDIFYIIAVVGAMVYYTVGFWGRK